MDQLPGGTPYDHAQLYELLISELTDFAIFLTDPEGCITSWNPGVERLLGYTKEEWLGQSASIIFTPEDRAAKRPEEEMAQAVGDGRAPDRRWHQRKDGSRLYVEGTLVALRDPDGRLIGFSKILRDLTERVRTEETLRRSEERYRTLFNSIDQGFCIVEVRDEPGKPLDYRFIEVNAAFERQSTLVNATGRWMREMRPAHEEQWFEIYRRVAVTGEPVRFEQHGKELQDRWFDVYAFRVGTPEQKCVGTLFTDITARRRLEQELRASEERLRQVLAQAPVGVCVLRGPELVFELVNPSYQAFLPGRPLTGLPMRAAIPELDPGMVNIVQQVFQTGEPFAATELQVPLDRDGDGVLEEVWFNLLYHPLREAAGSISGVIAVAIDVTPQVRAREQLQQLNRGLEEFAYVASHDLQEPLRMIKSYSQLLVRRLGDEVSQEQRQYADFIQQGANRMEQLVKDLLSYSRTVYVSDEATTGQADLNDAVEHALVAMQAAVAETAARITYEPLPKVRGDTTQLAHVFQNLLSNALKYRKPDETPRVHITAQSQGDEWIISVRDNGIGFDARDSDRIFGLFKRLHGEEEYPGTGLGLAICKRIIERYGGRIWAKSELKRGSTFFFALRAALREPDPYHSSSSGAS